MEYAHQIIGEDITSISGTYTPLKELRLPCNDREVLCIIGMAVVDTACCGSGNFAYANVPGYIVSWKQENNESGLAVSKVEPIDDDVTKRAIVNVIKEREQIRNINFW